MMFVIFRAGETPYNIDVSNQKTILSLLFGSRKLNTNLDTENMLGRTCNYLFIFFKK